MFGDAFFSALLAFDIDLEMGSTLLFGVGDALLQSSWRSARVELDPIYWRGEVFDVRFGFGLDACEVREVYIDCFCGGRVLALF